MSTTAELGTCKMEPGVREGGRNFESKVAVNVPSWGGFSGKGIGAFAGGSVTVQRMFTCGL